jgi:DNA-binding Lrp family transcriptional regulator
VTARSLGEVLGGLEPAKRQRSFQPVRRNSYFADDPRACAVWRPISRSKQQARAIVAMRMQAAQAYDRQHKPKGKKNGPLGYTGIDVLRELYGLVDYRTGRLDPSMETLRKRTGLSKQAVSDALKRLEDHGFLIRVRRAERIENAGKGPQVRQITNAYGLPLPKCIAERIERKASSAPLPDCELSRRAAFREEAEAMLNSPDPEQYLKNVAGNDNEELLDVLLRLQAGLG